MEMGGTTDLFIEDSPKKLKTNLESKRQMEAQWLDI
jgi:hypothetical protein